MIRERAILTDKYYYGLFHHLINEKLISYEQEETKTVERMSGISFNTEYASGLTNNFKDFWDILKRNRHKRKVLQIAFLSDEILLPQNFGFMPNVRLENLIDLSQSNGLEIALSFGMRSSELSSFVQFGPSETLANIRLIGKKLSHEITPDKEYRASRPPNTTFIRFFEHLIQFAKQNYGIELKRKDFFNYLISVHLYEVYRQFFQASESDRVRVGPDYFHFSYLPDYYEQGKISEPVYKFMRQYRSTMDCLGVWDMILPELSAFLNRHLYLLHMSKNENYSLYQNSINFSDIKSFPNQALTDVRDETLALFEIEFLKHGIEFPTFSSFKQMLRHKSKKLNEIRRFNEVLSHIESEIISGQMDISKSIRKEIDLASRDLNRGMKSQKVSSFMGYMALPISVVELFLGLPPALGITGTVLGTTAQYSSTKLKRKSSWLSINY